MKRPISRFVWPIFPPNIFGDIRLTAIIPLGRFEKVPLRNAWPTEDGNFTPWLAEAGVISLLGDALNLELEVEAVEHWVGDFKADILARVVEEADHRVVIENQFGRTDHGHLGQFLTYLAGIEGAKTVVWIAETIRPDHRAALDWLNTNTSEEFSFFALEIELWRIGESHPAPRFNVITSPNDWTRATRAAARQAGEAALTDRHHMRLAYWASFAQYLEEKNPTFRIRRPNKDHWFSFAVGRSGFVISATISSEKERIGVEFYVTNDIDKAAFRSLYAQKDAIQKEFGEPLEWQELPGKKASRIVLYKYGVDPSDEKQYPELHSWMLSKMERFRKVFAPRVKSLPVRSSEANLDGGEPPEE